MNFWLKTANEIKGDELKELWPYAIDAFQTTDEECCLLFLYKNEDFSRRGSSSKKVNLLHQSSYRQNRVRLGGRPEVSKNTYICKTIYGLEYFFGKSEILAVADHLAFFYLFLSDSKKTIYIFVNSYAYEKIIYLIVFFPFFMMMPFALALTFRPIRS